MKNAIIIFITFIVSTSFFNPPKRKIEAVDKPSTDFQNTHYIGNKNPLKPLNFIKLPIGSIKPGGWLLKNLQLQNDGLTGHLGEISIWLTKKNNAWLNKDGKGDWGWEELPYWLKGYANIGYMLNDKKVIDEAKVWLEGTIKSQRDNGDFGPIIYNKAGKRDLWAQMLMLFCLQSYYEYSHNSKVLDLMTLYFKWELALPDDQFLEDYWEKSRGGDNLYSVYWLYNQTGEKWLLDLGEKIHRNTANWEQANNLPNWHNVNIAQCFREPATYFLQSGKEADLQATYNDFKLVRNIYGQVPGGMFGADENARKGYDDPHQAVETCGMVEQMNSDEMLLRFTGDTFWAENCENVAFNTLPAAFMPDYKSLRYLTAPNMVVSDSKNHSPGIQNEGPFLAMNPFSSRCCQHNHAFGWVYYAENLWMATPDNGLAAVFYSSSEVKAKVGDGTEVSLKEETNYPFEEQIKLTVNLAKPSNFPLYLRIPTWCINPVVKINNQLINSEVKGGQYVKITETWKNGDKIILDFPMKVSVKMWEKNKNSLSVNYGALTFSLKIKENYVPIDSKKSVQEDAKWQPNADHSKWQAYEILPASAWNYGLLINQKEIEKAFKITKKPFPKDNFPFTTASVPIELTVKAKKIPTWTIDQYGLCGTLPLSPVTTGEPTEEVTLIPMGAARLRISAFPTVE